MKRHLTVVIKLGTSSIVDENTHEPLLSILTVIVETAVKLHKDGHKVIIVSSGAIGVGLRRMDMSKRPKQLPKVQALAAIGQCRLMSLWDQLFAHLRQPVAQILLTRSDIADRTQYLNAQNTLHELLHMGVIPIVNENDTLSVSEIKFGDNDTLSAIAAGMVSADYLFLMTDVDCLYTSNPRHNPDAKPIEVVEDIADLTADVSSRGSALGTGGMSTKIVAARLATSVGVTTVITSSSKPGHIFNIIKYIEAQKLLGNHPHPATPLPERVADLSGGPSHRTLHVPDSDSYMAERPHALTTDSRSSSQQSNRSSSSHEKDKPLTNGRRSPQIYDNPPAVAPLHTRFLPDPSPIRDRKFWLLHGLAPHGTVYVDEGAAEKLKTRNSLLPVGVVDVEGHFAQHECVRIVVVRRTNSPKMLPHTSTPGPTSAPTSAPRQSMDYASMPGTPKSMSDSISSLTGGHGHYEKTNPAPVEIGRCLVNYAATEIMRIRGHRSTDIPDLLGYADSEYVAFRENIALHRFERSRPGSRAPTPTLSRTGSFELNHR